MLNINESWNSLLRGSYTNVDEYCNDMVLNGYGSILLNGVTVRAYDSDSYRSAAQNIWSQVEKYRTSTYERYGTSSTISTLSGVVGVGNVIYNCI